MIYVMYRGETLQLPCGTNGSVIGEWPAKPVLIPPPKHCPVPASCTLDVRQHASTFNASIQRSVGGFRSCRALWFGASPAVPHRRVQILLRQAMVLRLRILAPALFLPTLASAISLTVQRRHDTRIWLHIAALALLGVWIMIRVLRTVPVNSATLEWNPLNPPEGWRAQVERTERFHVLAAWAAVTAFVCFLLSAFHEL